MARMIPAEYVDFTDSKAEELVYNTLKKALDDEWTVFYSYNLKCSNETGAVADAEIDFLIFNPSKGMLVLEVKGGAIEYRDGVWYQNHQPQKDFLKQALKNKYAIAKFLLSSLFPNKHDSSINDLPFILTHALCFPDCFSEIKKVPSGCEDIIINGSYLSHIRESIESILKNLNLKYPDLERQQAKHILRILMPESGFGVSIFDRIERDEREIFSLTEEQCRLLEFIGGHREALIKGCAGSGKTTLAIKKSRELALAGNNVLLLCFNSLLGRYMANELNDLNDKVRVSTFHKFCVNELKRLNIPLPGNPGEEKHWNEEIPEIFADKAVDLIPKYDAIIVDEGQDFLEFYWYSISQLRKEDGYFYIFYDEQQNIFRRELRLPLNCTPFILSRNCRNTRAIIEKIRPYASESIMTDEKTPSGIPVTELFGETPKLRRNHLSKILHDLIENENVRENEIVILGGHSIEHTSLAEDTRVGKFTISTDGTAGEYVIPYYTYMKFKGCEAPVVILLDVCEGEPRWNRNELYTAMSRAKHLLYIIRK